MTKTAKNRLGTPGVWSPVHPPSAYPPRRHAATHHSATTAHAFTSPQPPHRKHSHIHSRLQPSPRPDDVLPPGRYVDLDTQCHYMVDLLLPSLHGKDVQKYLKDTYEVKSLRMHQL